MIAREVEWLHFRDLKWPGVERQRAGLWFNRLNRLNRKLGFSIRLAPGFDHFSDMVSLEQAGNLNLLLGQVVLSGVAGDVVELGCYTGSTTCIIGRSLSDMVPERGFHVFDRFDVALGAYPAGRDVFERNLRQAGLSLPLINQGDVLETVPDGLPGSIAFAHIDLGTGGDVEMHRVLMTHVLRNVYDRMTPGAILVLMDYHIPGVTVEGNDSNPGVRKAVDMFFADKSEKVVTLYGGPCSHGYVRKQA